MLYRFARSFLGIFLRLLYRVSIEGDNTLSGVEGCIVYANHTSYLDPIVICCFTHRQIRYMAKKELFRNRLFGWVIYNLGTFPVRRGEADITAVKKAIKLLKNGEVLGIFPEGTRNRSGRFMEAEPGLSMLAIRARVPVVPVAVISTYRLFSPIIVKIGQPVGMEEYYEKRMNMDDYKNLSNRLMGKVYTMAAES